MGFLKRLADLFSAPARSSDTGYYFSVRCKRCGETLRGRVDMRNDLSIDYGEGDGQVSYFCRKVLIGEQRCFQTIEVELRFDGRHTLIERQVQGGEFIEE